MRANGSMQIYQADNLTVTQSKEKYDAIKNYAYTNKHRVLARSYISFSIFVLYILMFCLALLPSIQQPWLIELSQVTLDKHTTPGVVSS